MRMGQTKLKFGNRVNVKTGVSKRFADWYKNSRKSTFGYTTERASDRKASPRVGLEGQIGTNHFA